MTGWDSSDHVSRRCHISPVSTTSGSPVRPQGLCLCGSTVMLLQWSTSFLLTLPFWLPGSPSPLFQQASLFSGSGTFTTVSGFSALMIHTKDLVCPKPPVPRQSSATPPPPSPTRSVTLQLQRKRSRTCGNCGQPGHDRRSCPS